MDNSKFPELSDNQIALITKAALDNNAAIVQFCSFVYGTSRDVTRYTRKEWHKQLTKQWQEYQKQIDNILS